MKKIFVLVAILLVPLIGSAQDQEIRGTILAFNKFPVKNVSVKAKKAKTEVLTDEQGHFVINAKKKDMLVIEAKIFERYIHRLGDSSEPLTINLIYDDNSKNLDVAVEEGYLSREDIQYGLTYLAAENNVFANFIDVFEAIRYAIPAATFINENGIQKVQLRGTKSMEQSSAALYVVNGYLTEDISYIMPSSIKSIQQLTGPAAGRFGPGSGNGVISITTK